MSIVQGEHPPRQLTSGSRDPAAVLARLTARNIVVSTRQDDVHAALAALKDNLDLMVRA